MDINPSRPDAQQTGERPLNLSDFAQRNQITEDRVWELIEEGELAARFVNDEILILREQDAVDEPQIDLTPAPHISVHEPSEILPTAPDVTAGANDRRGEPDVTARGNERRDGPVVTARGSERHDGPDVTAHVHAVQPQDPRVTKTMDVRADINAGPIPDIDVRPVEGKRKADTAEFSRVAAVVKQMEDTEQQGAFAEQDASAEDEAVTPTDDYRDLLVFAQDAMNRTMDLSRQLLATKDELLRMKEERIQQLQAEQQRNEHEIRRLRKKVEDLETLCRLTPNP